VLEKQGHLEQNRQFSWQLKAMFSKLINDGVLMMVRSLKNLNKKRAGAVRHLRV